MAADIFKRTSTSLSIRWNKLEIWNLFISWRKMAHKIKFTSYELVSMWTYMLWNQAFRGIFVILLSKNRYCGYCLFSRKKNMVCVFITFFEKYGRNGEKLVIFANRVIGFPHVWWSQTIISCELRQLKFYSRNRKTFKYLRLEHKTIDYLCIYSSYCILFPRKMDNGST